jgi:hypothetical protein
MTDMTDADLDPAGDRSPATEQRLRAIAAGLTAAGLDAHVHETKGVLDLAATQHRAGGKDIEVICDEDLYVQIAYWHDPSTTPTEVVAVICRALSAITGSTPQVDQARQAGGQSHA